MLYGLKNSVVNLQWALPNLNLGHYWEEVQIYLIALIIFEPMIDIFLNGIERVSQQLVMSNLTLKLSKYYIGYDQLKYLGHVVR